MLEVLRPTTHGLFCEAGRFYIDPVRPVTRAIITHAHADHARSGHGHYLCSKSSERLLRERVGKNAGIQTLAFGEELKLGDAHVSLHPAGHILGSAQVRVQVGGSIWVVTGDYKTEACSTCESYEPVPCDTFITECTFGLPVYKWPTQSEVITEINSWWRENQSSGKTSILLAYSLGKAQRILHHVDSTIGPIVLHGAVRPFVSAYANAGISMPQFENGTLQSLQGVRGRALVVAPPSVFGSQWLKRFHPYSIGFASGWMALRGRRRRAGYDRGFVLSDHADWPGLIGAIRATGANKILTTHGDGRVLVRYLTEQGLQAEQLGYERQSEE